MLRALLKGRIAALIKQDCPSLIKDSYGQEGITVLFDRLIVAGGFYTDCSALVVLRPDKLEALDLVPLQARLKDPLYLAGASGDVAVKARAQLLEWSEGYDEFGLRVLLRFRLDIHLPA